MKSGLKIGLTAEVNLTVSKDMCATFDGEMVHELYSTSTLVNHLEWAAHKAILPYLEEYETGMGYHVDISHLMLTVPGMDIHIKAIVVDIRDNKIVCDVEAFNKRGKVARGAITQAIVQKEWLDQKIKEASLIDHLSKEVHSTSK